MKNLLYIFILAVGIIGIAATSDQEPKIAFVDLEYVIEQMPETKKIRTVMREMELKVDLELAKETQSLRAEGEKLNKIITEGNSSDQDMQKALIKTKDLNEKMNSITTERKADLNKEINNLLEPIRKQVNEAIEKVAHSSNYKYVLDSREYANAKIVLLAPEGYDITNSVLTQLGLDEKKPK